MGAPLVFFGNERLATGVSTTAPCLRALHQAGYDIKAVVVNNDGVTSRRDRRLEIAEVANELRILVLTPQKLSAIADVIAGYGAAIGVLVAYGKMVPESIIRLFPKGIVNIHPSLLPLHRGSIPLESVILNGEERTGVSLMSLVRAMDAGPVYAQSEYPLTGTETKQELADSLLEVGAAMLTELLPGILRGDVVALPQDESAATYDEMIKKDDGLLGFDRPATVLERAVRAYATWPKSRTKLAGKEVVVTRTHCADVPAHVDPTPGTIFVTDDKQIGIVTIDQALIISELVPAGKKPMSAAAFLAGHRLT